jgi:magnesium-transporting ATPase (P-type)
LTSDEAVHLADDPVHADHGAAGVSINGLSKHNWKEAFFFALAVAVGLTPEMLPMIVSVCLSKGALAMSKKKVIVKRINSIQNFGAMDVLCTDKTGTLTMDHVILELYLRRVQKRQRGSAARCLSHQSFADRPEKRPRPRGAQTQGRSRRSFRWPRRQGG